MAKSPESQRTFSAEEQQARDEKLLRLLKTPPQPRPHRERPVKGYPQTESRKIAALPATRPDNVNKAENSSEQ